MVNMQQYKDVAGRPLSKEKGTDLFNALSLTYKSAEIVEPSHSVDPLLESDFLCRFKLIVFAQSFAKSMAGN